MKHLTIIITVLFFLVTGEAVAQQGRGNARQEREENRERAQGRIQGIDTTMKAVGDSVAAMGRGRRMGDQAREEATRQREQPPGRAGRDTLKAESREGAAEEGRALGRNKGDLSGRELGQAVAAQARMQSAEEKIGEVESKSSEGRMKIAEARQKLEEKKNRNEMTEEQYLAKKAELDAIEKEMERIEAESVKQKDKIQKAKGKK
jgi:chromosome segregation ATPase